MDISRPLPHDIAEAAAARTTSDTLRALFEACAAEWGPGFTDYDEPARTARSLKMTPIGRALLDLMEAEDPASSAYFDGFRAATEVANIREQYRLENMDLNWLENSDERMWTHRENECDVDAACTIHRRSSHHMRAWPQSWSVERRVMVRVCEHGHEHVDPDEAYAHADDEAVDVCDGCCRPVRDGRGRLDHHPACPVRCCFACAEQGCTCGGGS